MFMNSQIKTRRRPGRPPSGKKQFLVRMPPSLHETIRQIAQDNGLRVGDWLTRLHVLDDGSVSTCDDEKESLNRVRKQFLVVAAEASRLLEMLFECADSDPKIIDDASVSRAMSALGAKRKKLIAFLNRERPDRNRHC